MNEIMAMRFQQPRFRGQDCILTALLLIGVVYEQYLHLPSMFIYQFEAPGRPACLPKARHGYLNLDGRLFFTNYKYLTTSH